MRWVPHLLAEFKRHHPRVTLTLVERPSEHLLALLRDAELDVAWLVLAASGVNPPAGVFLERLASDDFVLVLPWGHHLAGRTSVSVHQLAAEPLIVPPHGEHGRRVIDEAFRAQGATPIVAFESSDRSIRLALAAEGLGVALSSALGVARGDPSLPTLGLQGAATRHALVLAWGEQAVRAKAAAAFVAFARERTRTWLPLATTDDSG
jgi:DNA-binding transcriptional LysR family regulator